jgi:hypothetical protein
MLFLIGQPFKTLAISQLHALSLLQKTVQIRDKFFLYMDPVQCTLQYISIDRPVTMDLPKSGIVGLASISTLTTRCLRKTQPSFNSSFL